MEKIKYFIQENKAISIWIILTFVYIIFIIRVDHFTAFTAFIGLFVPSAIWITILSQGLSILVIFLVMKIVDAYLKKISEESKLKKTKNQILIIFSLLFF